MNRGITPGHRGWAALAALVIGLLLTGPLPAAEAPTADFQLADYVVEIDGERARADVWQSRLASQILILSPQLVFPVRLRLSDAQVDTVHLMKVDKRPDGGLTLLPGAADRSLGKFEVSKDGKGVSFSLDGHAVQLKQKPPLLGRQVLAGMKAYSRDYVRLAEQYVPSVQYLDRLRSEGRRVRVEVYFGSWCSFCQQMVPRMMRVAEELAGSNIEVGFYGLPQGAGFKTDPNVARLGITGVPTGVVYIGNREAGRITTNGWKIPELSLNGILVKK